MQKSAIRVLVVDADAEVRGVVEDLLFDLGYEVSQAANEDVALRALRSQPFDVLLCHLDLLRDGDGRLRREAQALHPGLWITATSASGAMASEAEAHANLAKPFTRSELVAALQPSATAPLREPRGPSRGARRC